ncbi:hypothetical protein Tco_1297042 [Tanacetum coccineum]
MDTTHDAEELASMPYDSPLHSVHSHGSDEVKKLENQLKTGKVRKRAKIALSEDEDAAKDPSKQGRKIAQIDSDPNISLVQDEGTSWFQQDEEIHEKTSDDTEVLVQEETPTELVEDQGSGEKGQPEVTTADTSLNHAFIF